MVAALPFGDVASVIVTFSIVGFMIFLAIPVFMGLRWNEKMKDTEEEDFNFSVNRLGFIAGTNEVSFIFIVLSILFVFSGIMAECYWMFSFKWLIDGAHWLMVIGMASSVVLLFVFSIVIFVPKEWFMRIFMANVALTPSTQALKELSKTNLYTLEKLSGWKKVCGRLKMFFGRWKKFGHVVNDLPDETIDEMYKERSTKTMRNISEQIDKFDESPDKDETSNS